MKKGLKHLLELRRRDPESVEFLYWIWRRLYCLQSMRVVVPVGEHWSEVHIDTSYCLDRYTLEDA